MEGVELEQHYRDTLKKLSEQDRLRHKFDGRLAALRAPGAGDRLRRIARRPARLRGKVKAPPRPAG